jgi:hypothetical protein
MWYRFEALLPVLLVAACAAPRTQVVGRYCEFSAPHHITPDELYLFAVRADGDSERVAGIFSLPVIDGVVVAIMDDRFAREEDQCPAMSCRGNPPRIFLGLACLEYVFPFDHYIAHELTHLYLGAFPPLPYMIEEGLADHVGYSLLPPGWREHQLQVVHPGGGELRPEFLHLTGEMYRKLPKERRIEVCLAGFEFIRRVGFENLVQMIREGRASEDELRALMATLSLEAEP